MPGGDNKPLHKKSDQDRYWNQQPECGGGKFFRYSEAPFELTPTHTRRCHGEGRPEQKNGKLCCFLIIELNTVVNDMNVCNLKTRRQTHKSA